MTKTIWHSGPPPSCGWWPASAFEDKYCLRWWNGKQWSPGCFREYHPYQAGSIAKIPSPMPGIKWTERPTSWPERSFT